MMIPARRVPRLSVVVVLVALVVGACGPSSPTPTAEPSGPAVANPTAGPSSDPTASPSPSPVADVSAPFQRAYAAIRTGVMTASGTMLLGDVQAEISGTNTFNGPDNIDSTTATVAGVSATDQHAKVAGARYIKHGGGPWLVDTSAASTVKLGDQLKAAAASVTDAGVESHGGQMLHRLVPASQHIDPAAFGAGAGAPTNVQSSVTFWATDDGTPVAVTIELTWTQPSGSATVNGQLQMEFVLSELGAPHVIQIPGDVWTAYKSKRWAFRLAYPSDFDYSKGKTYEYFYGPDNQTAGAGRGATYGLTLNQIIKIVIPALKKSYNTKNVTNEPTTVAGVNARFLTVTGTYHKKKAILYSVIFVKGKYWYEVYWYALRGNEAADLVTFQQLLTTFSFK